MIQKLIAKFKALNPILQGLAALFTIIGVIGGFDMFNKDSSEKPKIDINHSKETEKDRTADIENVETTKDNTSRINKKTSVKTQSSTTETNTSLDNETKTNSIFSQYPLKNGSKQTISFFITKNGVIDSKITRAVSGSIKRLNYDVPSLFNKSTLYHFDDFISPSESFLKYHQVNEYLDYYFICDITLLDTKKTSGMNTYTSALNIEGYLINTKNNNTKPFPYRNIKGAGFSNNDANLNLKQDLEEKIVNFIKVNI